MSSEPRHYSRRYVQSWTVLSIVLGLVLFGLFLVGDSMINNIGHSIWSLLRWIFRPII